MMTNKILDDLLEREGGYVDHPLDNGGPTKYGITLKTLEYFRDKPQSKSHVRDLTKSQAHIIYRTMYWLLPSFHLLYQPTIPPQKLTALLLDTSVHHGPPWTIRALQAITGSHQDGIIGPETIHNVSLTDPYILHNDLLIKRIDHFYGIVKENPSQKVFLGGWLNRLKHFQN